MDAPIANDLYQFDGFRLDRRGGGLFQQDEAGNFTPVAIGSRALDVLSVLVTHHGELLTKQAIMQAVWPGLMIEEKNLTVQMSALRHVLDDGRTEGSCIQTESGRGYRFVAVVTKLVRDEVWKPPTAAADAETFTPGAPVSDRSPPGTARGSSRWIGWTAILLVIAAGAGGLLAVGGRMALWLNHDGSTTAAVAPAAARPAAFSPQDRRMSVIVMPFENSSGDIAQDGLAASITRDLTDILARSDDFAVIPAIAAVGYKGKVTDIRAIGRERDVHFVILGNARRQDGKLIVAPIVYDTLGDTQVWGTRLDRPDAPGTLEAIVQVIYESFWQTAIDVESRRALRDHPNDLDLHELLMAAMATRVSVDSKDSLLTRLGFIERALKLDPDNIISLEREARLRAALVAQGYSLDPKADIAIAAKAADRLLLLRPGGTNTLRAKSAVLRAQRNWDEAEAVQRKVLEKQPHESNRHTELGMILMAMGRFPEALESFNRAGQYAGGSDAVWWIEANLALAYIATGDIPKATSAALKAKTSTPPTGSRSEEFSWLALIAAQTLAGQMEKAQEDLQDFLAQPRSLRTLAQVEQVSTLAGNLKLLEGLRGAGMK